MKFDHTAHKALWNWIAENTTKKTLFINKGDWPDWEENGGNFSSVDADCFACAYDCIGNDDCSTCPLIWPDKFGCSNRNNEGLYDLWALADSWESKRAYAKQIANLPVKPGVECI